MIKMHLSSIRNKLQVSFCAIILFAVLCSGLSYYFLKKSGTYQQVDQQIATLYFLLQEARKSEKDFMLYDRKQAAFLESGKVASTLRHAQLSDSIRQLLLKLERNEVIEEVEAKSRLKSIGYSIQAYESTFKKFVEMMYYRGFRDHGLEERMRNYVHELQEAPSAVEREYVLMMRRHEKDFIMRSDLKYVAQIHEKANILRQIIEEGSMPHMDAAYKEKSLSLLHNYIAEFDKLVDLEKKLGLTDSTGLRGKLKGRAEEVEPQVAAVKELINDAVEQLQLKALLAVIGFIILLLVIGFGIAFMMARIISRPLILLDKVIQDVLKGDYDAGKKLMHISNKDELGRLAKNFGILLDQQHEHMQEISEKNRHLEATAAEDAKRQWAIEGLNRFTDLMKRKADLKETCHLILSELVKYTGSNQGGLFLLAESEEGVSEMQLAACYAYDRRKYIHQEVLPGEGLLGAAWLEKDTIYITDVPQDYINITSGLGGANPASILIVPLISENRVEGIIELASFNQYEKHLIGFVEDLALRFATVIEGLNMQEKTNRLLNETRMLAADKQAREEEMRRQMEELQATQEEMLRKAAEAQNTSTSQGRYIRLLEMVLNNSEDAVVVTDDKNSICYASAEAGCLLASPSLLNHPLEEFAGPAAGYEIDQFDYPGQQNRFKLFNNGAPVNATISQLFVDEQTYSIYIFKELKETAFAE